MAPGSSTWAHPCLTNPDLGVLVETRVSHPSKETPICDGTTDSAGEKVTKA